MDINSNTLTKAKEILNSSEFKNKLKRSLQEQIIQERVDNDLKEDVIIIDDELDKKIFTPEIIKKAVDFCKQELGITIPIKVVLSASRDGFTTHAYYKISTGEVYVYCKARNIIDVVRSIFHEISHVLQDVNDEITDKNSGSKNDGNDIENFANAKAGELVRKFGRENSNLYYL
mgnify:CR=1 FL=1